MTPTTGRSPPVLARVLCPFCGQFWFRYAAGGWSDEVEIICRGNKCRRLITFKLINGAVNVEEHVDRMPDRN